eukprot:546700_1
MSTQQKRVELLTFGYIKNTYNGTIPFQLMKLMKLFCDDWIYWILKDKKLKQFINSIVNEKIICSKSFTINGIQFEMYSYRSCANEFLVNIGVKLKYLPTNIKCLVFYTEIKCEALNCSVQHLYKIQSSNQSSYAIPICQLSELKDLKTICFNCIINIKYIKYKKKCMKNDYYSPINKMKKYSQYK